MSQIHADHPQVGYYRVRKGGAWLPVEILVDETDKDEYACCVGFKKENWILDPHEEWGNQGHTLWLLAVKNPISKDMYKEAFETGTWPDGGIGHNEPPTDKSYSGIQEGIENVLYMAETLTVVDTQDRADRAANLRDRLNGFHHLAEEMRVLEKEHFLQGGRKVDDKWRPLLTAAKTEADRLRDLVGPYLARIEREKLQAGDVDDKPLAGGAHGKRMALRNEVRFEIVDFDAALNAVKNAKEVREVVEKLVARAVKSGMEVPGVKTERVRVAV